MNVSIISHFLGPEAEGLPKLARLGYAGVEVDRRRDVAMPGPALRALLEKSGLRAACVMGADPGLAEEDAARRRERIEHLKDTVLWATEVGAGIVETVPMWRGPQEGWQPAFDHAVESLIEAGKFAGEHGVVIAIESVNRGETRLVVTLAQAVAMAKAINSPHVRVMGDTHHMHMVELDLGRAIREAGNWLAHFHFSDSDRLPPGLGSMDLKTVVSALAETGYAGALSLAEVRPVGDREISARHSLEYTRALISACELREKVDR